MNVYFLNGEAPSQVIQLFNALATTQRTFTGNFLSFFTNENNENYGTI